MWTKNCRLEWLQFMVITTYLKVSQNDLDGIRWTWPINSINLDIKIGQLMSTKKYPCTGDSLKKTGYTLHEVPVG